MNVLYDLISQLRVAWETWAPEDQSRNMKFSSSLSLSPGETAYHVALYVLVPRATSTTYYVGGLSMFIYSDLYLCF